jgi:two-component system, NarL family, response regulator DevR
VSAPVAARVRLMLVDDHMILREALKALLESSSDMVVVAEAATAAQAVAAARATRPHVVLMDVRLLEGDGIEATRQIRFGLPDTRVLVLTSFPDEDVLVAALTAGASGFVLKRISHSELRRSILSVAAGQSLLDASVTRMLLDRVRQTRPAPQDEKLARLTAVEERILSSISEGKTNMEIAGRVNLSDKTVKNHVSVILGKLEVARRSEAAAYFVRHSKPRP